MRILEIISAKVMNGAARYGITVARLLAQRGHEVVVMVRPELDLRPIGDWLSGSEIVRSTLRRTPRGILESGRWCRERRIEVMHTHMSSAHALGAMLRMVYRIPCVATAHATHFQPHWIINDRVICHNTQVMNYHHRFNLVPWRKLRMVPAFIDESFLDIAPEARAATRTRLGIPLDSLVLTTIGNAMRRKGVIDIVKALPQVRRQGHDACLVICGWMHDNEYRAQIDQRSRAIGIADRVIWLEKLPDADVAHLLRATDLYVQASRHDESGPLAVLEAMAFGLPVVGTTVGSMPDFIEPGITGELVPPHQPQVLKAIVAILGDDVRRNSSGKAARQRMQTKFGANVLLSRIETILTEAAGLGTHR